MFGTSHHNDAFFSRRRTGEGNRRGNRRNIVRAGASEDVAAVK